MSGGCIFNKTGASRHWLFQRISALVLIPLLLWFLSLIPQLLTAPHATIHAMVSGSWMLLLFVTLMLWHGSLGMEVIYEDYVPCTKLRRALIVSTDIAASIAVIGLAIILGIF